MMHVRMVTAQIKPGKLDEAVEYWRTTVAPSARELRGYVSARMLVDRPANRLRSVGFWESEADFQASVAWTQAHLAGFGEFLAAPPVIDGFDLVAELLASPR
jgi:heme-degrading monooxygenase HmoA